MAAITVLSLSNKVWMAEVPFYDAFFNILMKKCKAQPATGGLAEVYAILAVHLHHEDKESRGLVATADSPHRQECMTLATADGRGGGSRQFVRRRV
jgi:hypothetical protein